MEILVEFAHISLEFWEFLATAISILIVSFLLYKGYRAFQDTGSLQLLRGAFSIAMLYSIAYALQLHFLLWLLTAIIPTLIIVIAIIMQPELRRIFMLLGRQPIHYLRHSSNEQQSIKDCLEACAQLAAMKRGALIVFLQENRLKETVDSGVRLDSLISPSLLVSIFSYDTPLHDGAVIIQGKRILSAGCILPLAPSQHGLSRQNGTRHRSAFELARNSDSVALIVSEESGRISVAKEGKMFLKLQQDQDSLFEFLKEALIPRDNHTPQGSLRKFLHWHDKQDSRPQS